MAKLLMVVSVNDDKIGAWAKERELVKVMYDRLGRFIKSTGPCALLFTAPPGTKIQLFKVESDGVEELKSVTVRYEDHEGNEIEVADEIDREHDGGQEAGGEAEL
jgi:hypothetical protein